jgi:hypothetical protein
MEENNNKKCDCLVCKGNNAVHKMFGGENCGKHRLLRWIVGLLVLWAVFALGVKVGELKYTIKDGLRGGYYGMMGGYGDCSYGHDRDSFFQNMMGGQNMMYYFNNKLRNATSTK